MTKSALEATSLTGQPSFSRIPLPAAVPRSMKRAGGRTESSQTPAHIRVVGVELDEDDRAYIRRKLGMKVSKFATSIERISVRITDVNGPRGGVDQRCRIKVVLSGSPSVMVDRQHAVAQAAFDLALRAAEYALQRTLGRRRMKPLRRGEPAHGSRPWMVGPTVRAASLAEQ